MFLLVAVAGFFVPSSLGTGHGLIEELLSGAGLWKSLILLLILRMVLLLLANNVGITGGLFVPSLAFGAILGALCGKALIFANLLPEEYYAIPVLDLYAVSGIQPRVSAIRERLMPDGVHPNEAGYARLANRVEGFLRSL